MLLGEVDVSTVLVAVVAAATPSLLVLANGRQARNTRVADWARQDEVAAQAAVAARLLEERQDAQEARAREVVAQAAEAALLLDERQQQSAASAAEVAERLLAANERVATATAAGADQLSSLDRQVKQIHGLVNSTLTASMDAQAAVLRQLVELMDSGLADAEAAGRPADEPAVARRAAAAKALQELHRELEDRKQATEIAAGELAEAEKKDGES